MATITTSPRTRRLTGLAAVGITAALTLSACGGGVPTLEDTWGEVRQNLIDAESVTVKGQGDMQGSEMTLDLSGYTDDSFIKGSIDQGNGQSMELIGDAENGYMKPGEAMLQQMGIGSMADQVGDKWIEMPTGSAVKFSDFYDSFTEDIPSEDEDMGDYESETVDHNGQEVYKYSGTTDDDEPVALFINKDKELVRVEAESDGEPVNIDFENWNAVEKTEMPSADEIFTIPGM